uniref:Uncharacterized protein n=1 Tax=Plectus sambesii TaxID=2011161 RepID=A0A914WLF4_9BILA
MTRRDDSQKPLRPSSPAMRRVRQKQRRHFTGGEDEGDGWQLNVGQGEGDGGAVRFSGSAASVRRQTARRHKETTRKDGERLVGGKSGGGGRKECDRRLAKIRAIVGRVETDRRTPERKRTRAPGCSQRSLSSLLSRLGGSGNAVTVTLW